MSPFTCFVWTQYINFQQRILKEISFTWTKMFRVVRNMFGNSKIIYYIVNCQRNTTLAETRVRFSSHYWISKDNE